MIDFGIAQALDSTRLTMTGMFMGTPGYLSPEVIEGQNSTAVLGRARLGGHRGLRRDRARAVRHRVLRDDLLPHPERQPDLSGVPAPMAECWRPRCAGTRPARPPASLLRSRAAALDPAALLQRRCPRVAAAATGPWAPAPRTPAAPHGTGRVRRLRGARAGPCLRPGPGCHHVPAAREPAARDPADRGWPVEAGPVQAGPVSWPDPGRRLRGRPAPGRLSARPRAAPGGYPGSDDGSAAVPASPDGPAGTGRPLGRRARHRAQADRAQADRARRRL